MYGIIVGVQLRGMGAVLCLETFFERFLENFESGLVLSPIQMLKITCKGLSMFIFFFDEKRNVRGNRK